MAFTIPNEADAAAADQAEPDSRDFDVIAAGFGGSGVTSGCAVTAQGSPDMTVAVAAGGALVGGVKVNVAAGNVTITAADGTNPRFDLVVVDNAGAKSAVAGTPAANPVFPAIPASRAVLAAIHVPASDTTIAAGQITDKRLLLVLPITVRKTADQTYNSSDTVLQNDTHLFLPVNVNEVWAFEMTLLLNSNNNGGDWKFGWTVPAGCTMLWGAMVGGALAQQYWATVVITSTPNALVTESGTVPAAAGNLNHGATLKGIIRVGGTAGNVQFQVAQTTSAADVQKVLKDSHMVARLVG